jgi:FAD/FMN-containing dehydrogenase
VCAQTATPLTPQGGNTGLVGGQIPQGEVLLSLDRMAAIREVSPLDDVLVVEAGATLAAVHEAADQAERSFPLSLASEGSATVGGLISTNAGGTGVLRYGSMRALVLGLEAVLPDGSVFRGLKRLRKDNTGYDLKQLLIGAEGTLGVVTAAALKLFPRLSSRATAMVGVASPEAAVALLARAKAESGGAVEAFELVNRVGLSFALKHIPDTREPLAGAHPWYVLVELATAEAGEAATALERVLSGAWDAGLLQDGVVAQDQTQARAFWRLREEQSAAQKPEGAAWKHDVSVPVAEVPVFLERATQAVTAFAPRVRVVAFGHVGDGNIHYDVLQPQGGDAAAHAARRDAGARIVHDIVAELGGSISAEHGLGTMKSAEALRYKSAEEVAAQRAVRAALDPQRIMNPRVLF